MAQFSDFHVRPAGSPRDPQPLPVVVNGCGQGVVVACPSGREGVRINDS